MQDIATRAGVSAMAVSLAFRGSAKVSKETRARILKLARQMGYQPDPVLRGLIQHRRGLRPASFSGTLAYLNNSRHAPGEMDPEGIERKTFQGARLRATSLGFKLEEFWLGEPGMTLERSQSILQARGIRGLIVGPLRKFRDTLKLDFTQFSAVAIGFSLEFPRLNVVSAETFMSMLVCMRELLALGYRRIGLVIRVDQDEDVQNRHVGAYHAALKTLSVITANIPILRLRQHSENDMISWVEHYQPDVVIGPDAAIIQRLEQHGYRVPEDMGFACPFATGQRLEVAHADGIPSEIGRAAVDLLTQMIDNNVTGVPEHPRTLWLDPIWVEGASVRRITT
jgi:LacI family transcriptional regulator